MAFLAGPRPAPGRASPQRAPAPRRARAAALSGRSTRGSFTPTAGLDVSIRSTTAALSTAATARWVASTVDGGSLADSAFTSACSSPVRSWAIGRAPMVGNSLANAAGGAPRLCPPARLRRRSRPRGRVGGWRRTPSTSPTSRDYAVTTTALRPRPRSSVASADRSRCRAPTGRPWGQSIEQSVDEFAPRLLRHP
jgi:hypothetical protein